MLDSHVSWWISARQQSNARASGTANFTLLRRIDRDLFGAGLADIETLSSPHAMAATAANADGASGRMEVTGSQVKADMWCC